MPARPVTPARFLLLAGLTAASLLPILEPAAHAQTLNLGAPRPPEMGDAAAALALAAQLTTEAESIDGSTGGLPAVRRTARTLAARLLETGQREVESDNRTTAARGSVRLLLGRSLAARLPAIDQAAERPELSDPALRIIAADLASLGEAADTSPDDIERSLRAALAPLTAAAADEASGLDGSAAAADRLPLGGWISVSPAPDLPAYRAMVSALSASGTPFSSASVEALAAVDELASQADAERAFRRSSNSIRSAVPAAAAYTGSASGWPRWLGPAARTNVDPALERALALLADPGRRAQGLSDLRRHARIVGLIQRTDRLADDQAGRRACEALSNYLAAPPSNRELEAQLLAAYERALDLALAPASLPHEQLLARPLRPAWREFQDAARIACDRLADALPTMLNDSAAMTDPGVLALFNAANQALAEARGLHAITSLLTGQDTVPPGTEPVILDQHRDLATRLLTMSQVASRAGASPSGEGAAAKRDLSALALDIAAWRNLPAEDELRAAVATPDRAWTSATEGREHDLLDLVERTRQAYLDNIATDGTLVERAALRARMALLADLLSTVREVVTTQRMLDDAPSESPATAAPAPPTLNDWSGWELSRPAHRLLVEGLVDALSETVSLALRGEDERARLRIAAMRQVMAAALVPARLHLQWQQVRPAAVGGLDDIALGPPGPDAWLPVPREALAEFCRIAEELPGIRVRRDDAQDRAVRSYLTMLAQDTLAQLK